jgi:protein-glutamine gamma-glutamyltransferase
MKAANHSLSPRMHAILSLLAGLTILPHSTYLPLPINLYLLFLFFWRFASLRFSQVKTNWWMLIGATLGASILVYNQLHSLIGRDAGVALLSVMLMLKVLEVRRQRDLYVTVFISYFVVITHFLFNQSIGLALYLITLVVCLTTLLMEINRVTPTQKLFEPLLKTLIITLQAVPIAIILFILFPRISHPLWNLGNSASATTGMSDRVSPGSISRLAESSEVAFRAIFDRLPPKPQARYWRGLVIWDTDGFSWYNQPKKRSFSPITNTMSETAEFTYEIFLEAHYKSWLYSLDRPLSSPAAATLTSDFQILTEKPVEQPLQYRLASSISKQNRVLLPSMRQRALALADNVTQRQYDLVNEWRAKSNSDREFIDKVLNHYNQQPYVYTLSPPLYQANPIDQFLFEGKEGFCEHYATSFTQLMRIAGIPARLILGYQGGEYNNLGDYFIIRQYDAHAWSEVWLDKLGWVRIDPTSAVAPERIRHQLRHDFGEQGSPVMFQTDATGIIASTMRQVTHLLDSANVHWRRWVIGYSQEHQFSLMRKFGFNALTHLQWGLLSAGLIAIPLILIGLRLRNSGKQPQSPIISAYHRYCRRLSHVGIARQSNEGPLDYAKRASKLRPDLIVPITRITSLYIQLRYGPNPDKHKLQMMIRNIRQFHPGHR